VLIVKGLREKIWACKLFRIRTYKGVSEVRIIKGLREGGHGSADYKRLSARRVIPGSGTHAGPTGMHKAHLRLPSFAQESHAVRMLRAVSTGLRGTGLVKRAAVGACEKGGLWR